MNWGLDSVSVKFGRHLALDEVNLDIELGEVAVVVGGDGAGKTTLGRVLARLAATDGGAVRLPARDKVGYQPEASGTWPDLTVAENLEFVATAFRKGRAADRIDVLLEMTGLSEARDRLAAALSGGMRQKLGVAMALLAEPELLVLDEPTTGVDPVSRAELWRLISRAAAEGSAVVMTTTYIDEAERASRILALDDGRTLFAGKPGEVGSAVTGTIWGSDTAFDWPVRWRRGREWRFWSSGEAPPRAHKVEPDLTDELIAAAFIEEGSQ
ncbi:MAG: ABC transporter ATP-binding protein [Acidimicrobiia bacterium]